MKTLILSPVNILLLILITCTSIPTQSQVPDSAKGTFWDYTLPIDKRLDDAISKLTLEEKCDQLLHDAPAIPRLAIPAYNWWNEALHGVARFGRATIFPQPIGMAATFDPVLIEGVATAISDEARAKFNAAIENNNRQQYGGLTFWSPNVNIFRDPRWGRGMETWGECPYLAGTMAGAFVKGMQGKDKTYLKAASCAKHYAVHNGPEGDRHHFNALPSKKDFYETYLPAFEMLVKDANVEAVMCAYNRTYGEPCCGSTLLMVDLLRKEWGFTGHVMSDCGAINDFHQHHKFTETAEQSSARAIKHDVNLNCGSNYENLMQAIEQELITEEDIDRNLKLLWRTRFKLGLFDPIEKVPYNQIDKRVVNCKKHIKLARKSAQKTIVLTKNNGILPLEKNLKHLCVIGPLAADVDAMLGNYNGFSDNIVTVLEGVTGKIDLGTRMEYRHGFLLDRDNINKIGWAISEAQNADVTIVVMGINTLLEGEEGEAIASPYKSDRTDIKLPGAQFKYLKKIAEGSNNKIIAVILGGSPIDLTEVHEVADAVIIGWYPGEQGGNAIADVIFGDVSPSGKLPLTYPKSVEQIPPYDNYTMKGRTYKYMEKEPQYPFGFGLTYTSFEYSEIQVNHNGDNISISAKVKNTGDVKSEEVVQLYSTTMDAGFDVPLYDMKGYQRVNIEPGKTVQINFEVRKPDMENIDDDGNSMFVGGKYTFYVGGSLPSQRSIDLGAAKPVEKTIEIK
jgi:beta-glucosidase